MNFNNTPSRLSVLLAFISLSHTANTQDFSGTITHDTSLLVSGGLDQGELSNRTLGVFSISKTYQDSLVFYIDAQIFRGQNGSVDTGDIQSYSNIDASSFSRLGEVWLQKDLVDMGLRFKIGQIDANSEFAYLDNAQAFINSSMGFSPTISYLPTYPDPRLSINVHWETSNAGSFSLGVYGDENDSLHQQFSIVQWQYTLNDIDLSLGYWQQQHASQLSDASPSPASMTANGSYATFEGAINTTWIPSKSAAWFAQFGIGDKVSSEIIRHYGAGLVLDGFAAREFDAAGIGLTYIKTNQLARSYLGPEELAFEVFYQYTVNPIVSFKPNLQFILSPAADTSAKDAIIFTLRTDITF